MAAGHKVRAAAVFVGLLTLLGSGYFLGTTILQRDEFRDRINEESFKALQFGMTEGEVEEILGVPAGDYTCDETRVQFPRANDYFLPGSKAWMGDSNGDYEVVWAVFDENGRVANMGHRQFALLSFSARLRIFLGF